MVSADDPKSMMDKLLGRSKEGVPLFNLSIRLEGWRGPFGTYFNFMDIAEMARKCDFLRRANYVTSKGMILEGNKQGLHKFTAALNLYTPGHLDITSSIGLPNKVLKLENNLCSISQKDLPKYPVYTLEGLYSTLPDQAGRTKLVALVEEFHKRSRLSADITIPLLGDSYMFEKLEKDYQRTISDQ